MFVARQFPAFCTALRVPEFPENVLRNVHVLALVVLRQVRMVVHPDSVSDVENQAVHLSILQSPQRALDRVQIIQRCIVRHRLRCP